MKETRIIMGMPVAVEIVSKKASSDDFKAVFDYFDRIDRIFSTYKEDSQISKINRGILKKEDASDEVKTVFRLSEQTKNETDGYFDIFNRDGICDPSGLVKGWAINNAADILKGRGFENFYVSAGGDIQVKGFNSLGKPWKVGIRNPFNTAENIKVVFLKNNEGIATSGTYERGNHIYNPKKKENELAEIVSITVIAKNIYSADRFATAAFAMSISNGFENRGINFIERLDGFEAYLINNRGVATMTSGFEKYL